MRRQQRQRAVWVVLIGWVLWAAVGCQSMSPVKDSERDAAKEAMRASVPKKTGEIQEEIKRAQSQADIQEKAQKAQAKADKAQAKADKTQPKTDKAEAQADIILAGDPPAAPIDTAEEAETETDTAADSDILAQAIAVPSVAVTPSEDADLALGVYALDFSKKHPVIDGDTVRVTGLDSSLRLVGLDTEETFKNERDSEAAALGFKAYCEAKRGTGKFPAKFATPMGEVAAEWGRAWLKGVTDVRLEYDETRRKRDVYDRYLVYVLMQRDGQWYNYNLEAVRARACPPISPNMATPPAITKNLSLHKKKHRPQNAASGAMMSKNTPTTPSASRGGTAALKPSSIFKKPTKDNPTPWRWAAKRTGRASKRWKAKR